MNRKVWLVVLTISLSFSVALAGLEVLLRAYNPLEIRFRPDWIV